jgi:hypothetical protein
MIMKKLLGIVVKLPYALNQAPRNQRRDRGKKNLNYSFNGSFLALKKTKAKHPVLV